MTKIKYWKSRGSLDPDIFLEAQIVLHYRVTHATGSDWIVCYHVDSVLSCG